MILGIPRSVLIGGATLALAWLGWQHWQLRRQVREIDALEVRLDLTQRKLSAAEAKLGTPVRTTSTPSKLTAVGKPAAPPRPSSAVPVPAATPRVAVPPVDTTVPLVDTTVVHAPDTKLVLPNGMIVSSPDGGMVSDAGHQLVTGDLTIEWATSVMQTEDAFIDAEQGTVFAKTISIVVPAIGDGARPAAGAASKSDAATPAPRR